MVKSYEVTREFIGGILEGLTHTSVQRHSEGLQPKEGAEVANPIGGSPYRVLSVKEVANGQG